jgi:hypothetical protein
VQVTGPWSGAITVDGQRLAVDVRGADPRLLLVNGLGGGASVLEPLRVALPRLGQDGAGGRRRHRSPSRNRARPSSCARGLTQQPVPTDSVIASSTTAAR